MEIDAAEKSCYQKLIVREWCDKCAADWFRIARRIARPELSKPVGHRDLPLPEIERPGGFALFLYNRFQLAVKIQARDFSIHGSDKLVVESERFQRFFGDLGCADRSVVVFRVIEAKGREADGLVPQSS